MGKFSVQCLSIPEILFQNEISLLIKPKGRDVNTGDNQRPSACVVKIHPVQNLIIRTTLRSISWGASLK
jgi:hypothetical protein